MWVWKKGSGLGRIEWLVESDRGLGWISFICASGLRVIE